MAPHPRLLAWPAALAVWTFIALAFATSTAALLACKGEPQPFGQVLFRAGTEWYLWALLAPLIVALNHRFPLSRARWAGALPVHLLGFVVVLLLHEGTYVTLERLFGMSLEPPAQWSRHVLLYIITRGAFDLLVYGAVVGLACLANMYHHSREREVRASQLESQLTRAQLEVLRSQLQPHFLFNTLNAISSLIQSDAAAADRVVSRLGDLLRLSLQHTGRQELPLHEELEFLGHYIEIQHSRFRDRLEVRIAVPDDALKALVPTFVLQPLVENAIRHGIEPSTAPGRVEVRAEHQEGRLVLEVSDNGPGLTESPSGNSGNGRGIGLTNTRARLLQLYGADQAIALSNLPDGGVRVRLEFPWREGEPADA